MTKIKVEIENTYEDHSSSKRTVELDAPPVGIDFEVELGSWFEDVVWPHTGRGEPGDEHLSAHYLATIVEADGRPELVGEWFEWV
jgi:hypothetical protein